MKNIYEILKEYGMEVPADKKADFDKAWKENYRTKSEYDNAVSQRDNNDGYSVSYDTGKSLDSMLYEIAEVYLVNTGLMSLAVDDNADECDDYNL